MATGKLSSNFKAIIEDWKTASEMLVKKKNRTPNGRYIFTEVSCVNIEEQKQWRPKRSAPQNT